MLSFDIHIAGTLFTQRYEIGELYLSIASLSRKRADSFRSG